MNYLLDTLNFTAAHFKKFILILFVITLFRNIAHLALALGVAEGTMPYSLIVFFETLIVLWFEVAIILKVQKIIVNEDYDEKFMETVLEGSYNTPSYFLYSLLYGLFIVLGFLFVIFPGLIVAILFFLVPYVAILEPDTQKSYFSRARELVTSDVPLLILTCVVGVVSILPFAVPYIIMAASSGGRILGMISKVGMTPFYSIVSFMFSAFIVYAYNSFKVSCDGGEEIDPENPSELHSTEAIEIKEDQTTLSLEVNVALIDEDKET